MGVRYDWCIKKITESILREHMAIYQMLLDVKVFLEREGNSF